MPPFIKAISILLLLATAPFAAAEKSKSKLHIIFFTPSDVEAPDGVHERLTEYLNYAEAFYSKGMKQWNYPAAIPISVDREANGNAKILFIKGDHNHASGKYSKVGFQSEVVEKATKQLGIERDGQVWWIFTYKGPENRGFRGGGDARRGGTSTSIYDPSIAGHLLIGDDLGSETQMALKSKASIHELGHALGLPHIGPIIGLEQGNSLMGPVIKAYSAKYPDEDRVYLTEASAAMLYNHPLFSGTSGDIEITPSLTFEDFNANYDVKHQQITVTGKVASDQKAHSVIIANETDQTRSPYWRKCYVGRVSPDGAFTVKINELDKSNGQLRIVACFNNGTIVGELPGLGLSSGFVRKYQYADESFTFESNWAPQVLPANQRKRN